MESGAEQFDTGIGRQVAGNRERAEQCAEDVALLSVKIDFEVLDILHCSERCLAVRGLEIVVVLRNITNEINDKVTELAQENGATIIFDKRLVTASTSFVVDLTPEIVSRVKLLRPRILDE